MSQRFVIYQQYLAMQDHNVAIVALIALGLLLGYAALNWFPPRVQNAARFIYLGWMLCGFFGSFILVWLKG